MPQSRSANTSSGLNKPATTSNSQAQIFPHTISHHPKPSLPPTLLPDINPALHPPPHSDPRLARPTRLPLTTPTPTSEPNPVDPHAPPISSI